MKGTILIVDDDVLVRDSLSELLGLEGYQVLTADDGVSTMKVLQSGRIDLCFMDLRLPDRSGIQLLEELRADHSEIGVFMMTGFGTIETAVEAMKMGALNYLAKPINDDEIRVHVTRFFETKRIVEENQALRDQLEQKKSSFHHLIGSDPKMQRIYSLIEAISDTDTTVLLNGESGTGKGMIAQAIHRSDLNRRNGPLVEVSCGAIPRDLLESELFGHVKGAFTGAIRDRVGRFEMANGGTILLDEIDALPPYLQVKLLRVLHQKTFERVGDSKTIRVDARIIAATNRNLEDEIKRGTFREDLYYRLNVITIAVPPLRDRKSDIQTLVDHFVKLFSERKGRDVREVSPEMMQALINYEWPGNVRELENLIERAVVLTRSNRLDIGALPDNFKIGARHDEMVASQKNAALKEVLKEPEKQIILRILDQTGWNRKKAAALLQINRTTLYNKMKEHQLL